jgi:hypothetical protein
MDAAAGGRPPVRRGLAWEAEASIDGCTAVRRHYRGFMDPGSTMAFREGDPAESCRLLDRHTGEAETARRIA